jgi:predicted DCC family thiol-disulfide oxidoreductase YuxK
MLAIQNANHRIILFDGICIMCIGVIQTIIKRDIKGKFRFTPLQSEMGLQLMKQSGYPPEGRNESIVYFREGKCLIKSAAMIMIWNDLGGIGKLFYAFLIIPAFIRDLLYNFVSKRRYKLFGRMDSCMVPSPAIRERFL